MFDNLSSYYEFLHVNITVTCVLHAYMLILLLHVTLLQAGAT